MSDDGWGPNNAGEEQEGEAEAGQESGGGGAEGGCRRCGEEGHFAKECPLPQTCRRCKQEGHMMAECPEPPKCGNCREEGHMTSECPEPEVCRRCKKEGHKVADCPEPMRCNRCGEEGHMSRECTEQLKTRTYEDAEGNTKEIYVPKDMDDIDADELFKMRIATGVNFSKYSDIPVKVTGENAPEPVTSFANAKLHPIVLKNVEKSGYSVPTPVQKYAIPIIREKRDLMACAQTGSGKTAAFMVPIISRLLEEGTSSNKLEPGTRETVNPECVVVTPTRELAKQIQQQAKKFSQDSDLRAVVVYGQTSVHYQMEDIRKGCNILVATPGRLNHFIENGSIGLKNAKFLVLDEADRMLEEGFMAEIEKAVTTGSMATVGERQTLMFSATFSDSVQVAAQAFLKDYLFFTVGLVGAICSDVEIAFHEVESTSKRETLEDILGKEDRDPTERTMIFVGKKTTADYLTAYLSGEGYPATSIHGDRAQRQREEALADFASGKFPILVATSVAGRGLDIPLVQHVINYDMPNEVDEYVHRIGRTGRVGNLGKATSLFCPDTDGKISAGLVKVLADAEKEVPSYLTESANENPADEEGGAAVEDGGDDDW